MKAIILAAGEGRRLRPLTDDRPKCLVTFHGTPLIDFQLSALRTCGVSDIVVVTGHQAEALQRAGVRCVRNPDYAASNMVYSLFCAEEELNEDLIVCYGDLVFHAPLLRALVDAPDDIALTYDTRWRELWDLRMRNPLADAETFKLDREGHILELGRKAASYAEIQGQYMGLIKFSGTILGPVKTFYHRLDRARLYDGKRFDDMFMTTFLQLLIDAGFQIRGIPVAGGWVEIDRISDLLLPLGGIT